MKRFLLFALLWTIALRVFANPTWHSIATGSDLALKVIEPARPVGKETPLIIYLTHLPAPRIGTEDDEAILSDFRASGYLVAVLDYGRLPGARWPTLNLDLVELRSQLQKRNFLPGYGIDPVHVYIIPSGHRLKRDVVFYRDGTRTLALDIIYPARPAKPAGTVLEFSCDNENRMGNFSLHFCSDTILEGAATEGFAVAMADHPVAAPYKGLDPMPDSAWKAKAAVRTLRAESAALRLSSRIVPVGFSRGSGMALLLATTGETTGLDGPGGHPDQSSAVQGAVVMSGRFTYLDLLPNDKMIPRYTAAWGERAANLAAWRAHSALEYLKTRTAFPFFLTINVTESPDALHQMEVLRSQLAALRAPFEFHLDPQPRGHRVPLEPALLSAMLAYFHRQLDSPHPPAP